MLTLNRRGFLGRLAGLLGLGAAASAARAAAARATGPMFPAWLDPEDVRLTMKTEGDLIVSTVDYRGETFGRKWPRSGNPYLDVEMVFTARDGEPECLTAEEYRGRSKRGDDGKPRLKPRPAAMVEQKTRRIG